jgi:hypothetical protein
MVLVGLVGLLLLQTVASDTHMDPLSPFLSVTGGRTLTHCPSSNDCYVEYDWPCVTLSFIMSNVTGNQVMLDMYGGGNYFQVEIYKLTDEASQQWTIEQSSVLQTDALFRKQYSLLSSGIYLDGTIKINVIKRTEASGYMVPFPATMILNPVKFYGFSVTGDSIVLEKFPILTRKIEMFSDSDSNGFGIEGAPKSLCMTDMAKYEACNKGYPRLIANALNAELHVEGWSGKGVVRGAADLLPNPETRAMPVLWNHTLATSEDGSPWNFNSWVPDVVIVSLGSNDFLNLPSYYPANDTFIAAYVNMLTSIRTSYPDTETTKLVVLTGGYPLDVYARVHDLSSAAIKQYESVSNGDEVTLINIPETELNKYPDNYGCLDHRNVQGQINVANFLIPKFKDLLGW